MSTYKIVEIVGSSSVSWTEAARTALDTAARTLEDLRVAEVTRMDMRLDAQGNFIYRTRLKLSFKVHGFSQEAPDLGAKPYAAEEE